MRTAAQTVQRVGHNRQIPGESQAMPPFTFWKRTSHLGDFFGLIWSSLQQCLVYREELDYLRTCPQQWYIILLAPLREKCLQPLF